MANLTPIDEFSDVVQIETTDIWRGGSGGKANEQAQALTNRTYYLNNKLTDEVERIDNKDDSQDEDIESLENRATALENEVINARGGKTNLDTRLDDIESVNTTQNTNISNLQTEVTNARGGKTNLKTRIDEIATSVSNLSNGQVTTNKNNIATHTTQINSINTQISNANGVVGTSTLKATVENLIARINTKQASGSYVLTSNIVTNYTTNNTSKVLAANVGVLLKSLIDGKQASGNYVTWSQVANAISNDTTKVARADTVFQTKNAVNINMPVGSIIMIGTGMPPTGWLECNGQQLSTSSYSDLYNVIKNRYGSPAPSSGYFRVPNLNGRFPEGNSLPDVNNCYAEPGLPNITAHGFMGEAQSAGGNYESFRKQANNVANNALYYTTSGTYWGSAGGIDGDDYVGKFDASRCSVIYGKSSTVQPAACRVMFIIKYRRE